jgi:hypothetical protein
MLGPPHNLNATVFYLRLLLVLITICHDLGPLTCSNGVHSMWSPLYDIRKCLVVGFRPEQPHVIWAENTLGTILSGANVLILLSGRSHDSSSS